MPRFPVFVAAFACAFGAAFPATKAVSSATSADDDSAAVAREYFLRARDAERRGDAATALEAYGQAFHRDPKSRDLCFLYLGRLAGAGEVDSAVATARACERLAGTGDKAALDVSERKVLGAVALRAGDRASALRHYRAAHDLDGDDGDVLLVLSGLYEAAGEWEAYLGVAEPLLRRLDYPSALLDRIARAYGRLDRPDSALLPLLREAWEETGTPAYGQALAIVYEAQDRPLSLLDVARSLAEAEPGPGADWMLARAYAGADRPDSALIVSERLLKDPDAGDLPGVRYLRASLLFDRGRYKESLKLASALAREFPDVAADHLLAGSAAMELRDPGARASLEKAYALAPGDPDIRARLAYADYVAGDTARASSRLVYAEGDPEERLMLEGAAQGRLARELEPRGAWERPSVYSDSVAARRHRLEAVARFEKVIARNSGQRAALFEAAAHLERLGERERAKELLRRLIAKDTANALAMNYLAYTLIEQDTVTDAEREESGRLLARALELAPENGAYRDSKGWWYYRAGEYDSAYTWLTAATEAIPGDPSILEHMVLVLHALGRRPEACEAWHKLQRLDPGHAGLFLHCPEEPKPAAGSRKSVH
jgi:tetratricopeptide (TPR) repeat protein